MLEVVVGSSNIYSSCCFIAVVGAAVEKSDYLNACLNGVMELEKYIFEETFTNGKVGSMYSEKDYNVWVQENGSIKQSYTTPALIQMSQSRSIMLCSNEGDGVLAECSLLTIPGGLHERFSFCCFDVENKFDLSHGLGDAEEEELYAELYDRGNDNEADGQAWDLKLLFFC
ncbi:unnamed protein product [Didymodactylos carnosus]|uniref:Uncharacterized protein n=1 Tax=Didymodactylos carnosus TaxID=1234261 RepID=A0A815S4A9_9BILA|nr:unnamed protein product [Didymodactylos carnosus]CAF4349978.1 unnamed protein product [Didymodactylos carnosus]